MYEWVSVCIYIYIYIYICGALSLLLSFKVMFAEPCRMLSAKENNGKKVPCGHRWNRYFTLLTDDKTPAIAGTQMLNRTIRFKQYLVYLLFIYFFGEIRLVFTLKNWFDCGFVNLFQIRTAKYRRQIQAWRCSSDKQRHRICFFFGTISKSNGKSNFYNSKMILFVWFV